MPHQCPECSYCTSRNANLERHIQTKHKSIDILESISPDCICSLCKNEFANKYSRDRHYIICLEKQSDIYEFDSKKMFTLDSRLNIDFGTTQQMERLYVLSRVLITDHYKFNERKNIYIVKGFCYIFTAKGWVKTREEEVLTELCKTFIKSVSAQIYYNHSYSEDVNITIHTWLKTLACSFSIYSTEFSRIYQILKDTIQAYSLERFPNGYFKKFKRRPIFNLAANVDNYIRRKKEMEKNKFFGFSRE